MPALARRGKARRGKAGRGKAGRAAHHLPRRAQMALRNLEPRDGLVLNRQGLPPWAASLSGDIQMALEADAQEPTEDIQVPPGSSEAIRLLVEFWVLVVAQLRTTSTNRCRRIEQLSLPHSCFPSTASWTFAHSSLLRALPGPRQAPSTTPMRRWSAGTRQTHGTLWLYDSQHAPILTRIHNMERFLAAGYRM